MRRTVFAIAELLVKCMFIFIMKSYVKVQKRLQTRQNIETKRHDNKRFSKKHILPYCRLIELVIWAELKNSISLLRPWGSDCWDRHLFLKHDKSRQRILFKFALLATRLQNHINFAVSSGKLNLYNI